MKDLHFGELWFPPAVFSFFNIYDSFCDCIISNDATFLFKKPGTLIYLLLLFHNSASDPHFNQQVWYAVGA